MTRMTLLCSAIVATALVPLAATAQSADTAYCSALAKQYERYLDMGTGHTQQPQSLETRGAVEKCKAGDVSGIPVIEKALLNAKIDLPPRG